MSALSRVVSGSAAAWARILLGFAQRLLLVPIILYYWSPTQYGSYLLILAWLGFIELPSRSHESTLANECLRMGTTSTEALGEVILSAVTLNAIISAALGLAIGITTTLFAVLDIPVSDAATIILGLGAISLLLRSAVSYPAAAVSAGLYCYGYQPRVAWLGVIQAAAVMTIPIAAIILGFDVPTVVIFELLGTALVTFVFLAWPVRMWATAIGIWRSRITLLPAVHLWRLSLYTLLRNAFEMLRQAGSRVILGPLTNESAVTSFSTTRTGANLALQGLSTVSGPVMPELMRFLRARDQTRMEAAFSLIWLPVSFLMCPIVLLMQLTIEPLFTLWTRAKIPFDPLLFALFSVSVLIFAAAQPAIAVVIGNNQLRPALMLSIGSGTLLISAMYIFVPSFGVRGAALAIILGELLSTCGYRTIAARWLAQNGLVWPRRFSALIAAAVLTTSVSLIASSLFQLGHTKSQHSTLFGVLGVTATVIAMALIWRATFLSLPEITRVRLRTLTPRL